MRVTWSDSTGRITTTINGKRTTVREDGMHPKDATGQLRMVCVRLFKMVQEATGEEPRTQFNGGWSLAWSDGKAILHIKLRGPLEASTNRYPSNSVVVKARWNDSFPFEWAEFRENSPDVRYAAKADDPIAVARAEDFCRWALAQRP